MRKHIDAARLIAALCLATCALMAFDRNIGGAMGWFAAALWAWQTSTWRRLSDGWRDICFKMRDQYEELAEETLRALRRDARR